MSHPHTGIIGDSSDSYDALVERLLDDPRAGRHFVLVRGELKTRRQVDLPALDAETVAQVAYCLRSPRWRKLALAETRFHGRDAVAAIVRSRPKWVTDDKLKAAYRSPAVCWHCGAEMPPQTEPVTISGVYQGRRYAWVSGRLLLRDVRCEACPEPEPQMPPPPRVGR